MYTPSCAGTTATYDRCVLPRPQVSSGWVTGVNRSDPSPQCPRDFEVFVYGGCACIVHCVDQELEMVVSYGDAGKKTQVFWKSSHYS